MSKFDVRENGEENISEIIFGDEGSAFMLTESGAGCWIEDGGTVVEVLNQHHAKNLIKALEKAITLGWLK